MNKTLEICFYLLNIQLPFIHTFLAVLMSLSTCYTLHKQFTGTLSIYSRLASGYDTEY